MDTEDLLWLGEEVLAALEQDPVHSFHPQLIAHRLQTLLQQQHSQLRQLAGAKWEALKDKMNPFSATAAGNTSSSMDTLAVVAPTMPTAMELAQAGLLLHKLVSLDSSLTGLVLVRAGVVDNATDLGTLGIKNLDDFVRLVGAPYSVQSVVVRCKSAHHWMEHFQLPLKLVFHRWAGAPAQTAVARLRPQDLAALGLLLGPTLDAQPHLWAQLPEDMSERLALATKADWLQHSALTAEHYERLRLRESRPALTVSTLPPGNTPINTRSVALVHHPLVMPQNQARRDAAAVASSSSVTSTAAPAPLPTATSSAGGTVVTFYKKSAGLFSIDQQ